MVDGTLFWRLYLAVRHFAPQNLVATGGGGGGGVGLGGHLDAPSLHRKAQVTLLLTDVLDGLISKQRFF
jgi:hypothetical protein